MNRCEMYYCFEKARDCIRAARIARNKGNNVIYEAEIAIAKHYREYAIKCLKYVKEKNLLR